MQKSFNFKQRLQAFGWHLAASSAVALGVAALVLGIWFPGAYRYMAGGFGLLGLIMAVDVVLGPVLTFSVFNTNKSRGHLRRDIATIAVIQMAALAYGMYSVYLARPVALVFENDRFRVLSAADVVTAELPEAVPALRQLSLTGPRTIAVRKSEAGAERSESLAAAVFDGVDTSQRPKFWTIYGELERQTAVAAARPLKQLIEKYPNAASDVQALLKEHGLSELSATFLPVFARSDAVAVLKSDGAIAGFLPYDGFF